MIAPTFICSLQRQQHALLAPAAVEVAALRTVARAGVDQRLAAAHVLRAGRDVDPGDAARDRVVALGDRDLDVDLEPAEGVHGVAEALEVDAHVVADVEAVQLAQQGLQRVEARARLSLAPRHRSARFRFCAYQELILPR